MFIERSWFFIETELSEDSEIGLCSYDMMLPDSPTIHGRLFLGAWDTGLDSVADETVTLMLYATEVCFNYKFIFIFSSQCNEIEKPVGCDFLSLPNS